MEGYFLWFHTEPQGRPFISLAYLFFYYLDKNIWKISDLEKIPPGDVYTLIDSIPSDNESVVSSESEDDTEIQEQPIFDLPGEIWEPEDELPLATFLPPPASKESQMLKNLKWSKNLRNVVEPVAFEEPSGPSIPEDIQDPLSFYMQLFSERLIERLVFETNLYATQKGGTFVPTTVEEIKSFIGINLLMGIKRLPSFRDYWSARDELRDHFISSSMPRNRFSWLLGNIHLNDKSVEPKKGEPGHDKLYKLRPMIETVSETYLKHYQPSRCQAIDESMIRFKGRISFRQYMPMKPIKRGYKMWVRANESGFVSQFQIYTGKANTTEKSLGERVVTELTRELTGKHYEVYMDNFFNSVQLQLQLQDEEIYSCGTARKDRKGFPKDLLEDKAMNRGDFDWRISSSGILAVKWKDNKAVHFLSNFHSPHDVGKISRKQKDGSGQEFDCIKLVQDYNKHMGYVDKSDMYKSYYEIDRKSKKWWHRIFWHFVDLPLVNAFLMYKEKTSPLGKTLSLKEFRLAVASGLIGANPQNLLLKRRSSFESIGTKKYKPHIPLERRTDKAAHMPVHGTKVRCANCSTRNEPHRTRWHCTSCNMGLCLTDKKNCYAAFHQK